MATIKVPTTARSQRRQRLRERQLALIRAIQNLAAEQPLATDMVSGWFDDVVSIKLISAGMLTLGDLNRKIATGGRWFSALPAIGQAKAQRIAAHLATLLPRVARVEKPVFALVTTPSLFGWYHRAGGEKFGVFLAVAGLVLLGIGRR